MVVFGPARALPSMERECGIVKTVVRGGQVFFVFQPQGVTTRVSWRAVPQPGSHRHLQSRRSCSAGSFRFQGFDGKTSDHQICILISEHTTDYLPQSSHRARWHVHGPRGISQADLPEERRRQGNASARRVFHVQRQFAVRHRHRHVRGLRGL